MMSRHLIDTLWFRTAGHTLIEAVVATSLMVTVLVPLSSMTIYLLKTNTNELYLEALALGQQAMEETLHQQSYASSATTQDGGRWHVQKTVTQRGLLVIIVIRVFRRNRPKPFIELATVRLLETVW